MRWRNPTQNSVSPAVSESLFSTRSQHASRTLSSTSQTYRTVQNPPLVQFCSPSPRPRAPCQPRRRLCPSSAPASNLRRVDFTRRSAQIDAPTPPLPRTRSRKSHCIHPNTSPSSRERWRGRGVRSARRPRRRQLIRASLMPPPVVRQNRRRWPRSRPLGAEGGAPRRRPSPRRRRSTSQRREIW